MGGFKFSDVAQSTGAVVVTEGLFDIHEMISGGFPGVKGIDFKCFHHKACEVTNMLISMI